MTWKIQIHSLVLKEDLPLLDKSARDQIFKAIRRKLSVDPQGYGEPLRKELFGYWKLRVGDYRVIYKIERNIVTVLILKIGMRKESHVYSEMLLRLKKLLEI